MMDGFSRRRSIRGIALQGRLIDRRFRRHWRNYLFQCVLATLTLLVILLVVDVELRAAIVVAIAPTAFIISLAPHSQASSPRRVIGGHVLAVLVGSVVSLLYLVPGWGEMAMISILARELMAVVSVGVSILLMVLTNTVHPPAAGTDLGLGVIGWDPSAVLFVLLGAITLSITHRLLRSRLHNLL